MAHASVHAATFFIDPPPVVLHHYRSAIPWRPSMPIDDLEFDALKKKFELEDVSVSPVTKAILGIASLMPLTWPIDKAANAISGHLAT
jgi:hypothetical protein